MDCKCVQPDPVKVIYEVMMVQVQEYGARMNQVVVHSYHMLVMPQSCCPLFKVDSSCSPQKRVSPTYF